jgi:hypothetical protein
MPLQIGSPELEEKVAAVEAAGYHYSDQHDLRLRALELTVEQDGGFAALLEQRIDKLAAQLEALRKRVTELEHDLT